MANRVVKTEIKIDRALKAEVAESHRAAGAVDPAGHERLRHHLGDGGEIIAHDPSLYLAGEIATIARFLAEEIGTA